MDGLNVASLSIDSFLRGAKISRVGMVMVELGGGQLEAAQLQLTNDWLVLMKEEIAYTYSPIRNISPDILNKERIVTVRRERVGGLGLSVKGGREHGLPVLISRIFKDQAANKTGQLFVGDAIIKVNGVRLTDCEHDEAVQCLKRAGEAATLTVKYFRPASMFLTAQRRAALQAGDTQQLQAMEEVLSQPEQQWIEVLRFQLLGAYVTKYVPGTDEPRNCGFEVVGMEGVGTGPLYVDSTQQQTDWLQIITHAIALANHNHVEMFNKSLVIEQHLRHMCWVSERNDRPVPSGGSVVQHKPWRHVFLTFRGCEVALYRTPPIQDRNWRKFENSYKIYECIFRIVKNDELEDDRTYCIVLESGQGAVHYLGLDSRPELLGLERAWHLANHHAVTQMKSKTYGCIWRGRVAGLTLDYDKGVALYDSQEKCYAWSYKLSQLRGSSDDGHSTLSLLFCNQQSLETDTQEIECTNLRTVLFAMHAFLCARLVSSDTGFLTPM